ncbi:MAG: hypothetical protein C5B57_13595 [Blastocatellia bacterium]|nr:MAG: hypothetical protein C5B57_13595 [Blastocatellia bacterium]
MAMFDRGKPIEATFSPDGRWVAYASAPPSGSLTSPERGVYVQPFPATGAKYQAPKRLLDYQPAWSRDGKELLYVAADTSLFVAVPVLRTQPEIAFGSPVPMQKVPILSVLAGGLRGYDILPDGRFVTLVPESANPRATDALSSELRVVEHWFEELKRLTPTK